MNLSLTDFILWLTTSAGTSAVLSFLFERWAYFQAQSAKLKPWIMYGASLAVALAAYAVIVFVPADVIATLQPWFLIAAGVTVPFVATQIAHKNDPAA